MKTKARPALHPCIFCLRRLSPGIACVPCWTYLQHLALTGASDLTRRLWALAIQREYERRSGRGAL